MKKIKTYKFKLVPNKEQEKTLFHYINTTRFIYNLCLDYKTSLYSCGISISKNDIQKELKDIKNETDWMKDVHSQVIQDVTDRLFISYDNFFRRVKKCETPGFPKFAKKDYWSSFKFKQGIGICENTNKIKLPKIGKIKFKKSQEIIGDIRNMSIKKEADGWYVSIFAELEIQSLPQNSNVIGVDLGLKDLMITSEGEVCGNPKTLNKWQEKLAKCQILLSKKKKGSNNRKKVKLEFQKLHQKIARIRKDNLHKISTKMVNENQVIICEDLKVTNMIKNHKLAKSISDAGWSMLTTMLEYKSDWYGRTFIKVNPKHTSQDCNCCGYRNVDLTLSVRSWTCPNCGTNHDRDINAAINIKNRGVEKLKEISEKNKKEAGHVFSTLKNAHGDIEVNRFQAEEQHEAVA